MASTVCHDRIIEAPEHIVKEVLLALCADKDVEKIAISRLDALTKSTSSASTSKAKNLKRKAIDDLAVCVQCNSPFYKDDNQSGDCLYHPGESEVDWDSHVWNDHDENCHGTIDSDWARKEYPGGFIWSCCDETGEDSAGCTRGRHKSDSQKAWKEASELDSEEYDSEDYEDWE